MVTYIQIMIHPESLNHTILPTTPPTTSPKTIHPLVALTADEARDANVELCSDVVAEFPITNCDTKTNRNTHGRA